MKKLSIIAGLVFTTVFFASCEQNEIKPQGIYSEGITETVDLREPEFITANKPSVKAIEGISIPATTEAVLAVENHFER